MSEPSPAITYDPTSWLVVADWLEEYGNDQPGDYLLILRWRWRWVVAQAFGFSPNMVTGEWRPGNTGVIFAPSGGSTYGSAFLGEVRLCDKTWRISTRHGKSCIWKRYPSPRTSNRYYRRRLWELADYLFACRGTAP